MALIDPLTGLYNQRYLMRHLRGLLESGQNRELAVLMIDVDHFKAVNDEYGHATGDKALRAVADVLRGNTRVFDSLARYGGEEFVVVMPGTVLDDACAGGRTAARRRSRRRRSSGSRAGLPADRQHRRRLPRAAAPARPRHCCTPPIVALYAAKRAGRNRVEIATPGGAERRGRRYLILASRNGTCLRTTGSYFFSSSLPVWVRAFFFVT